MSTSISHHDRTSSRRNAQNAPGPWAGNARRRARTDPGDAPPPAGDIVEDVVHDLATGLVGRSGRDDAGGPTAEQLFPLVYDEMRRIAGRIMSRESPGHTLQPTALVHEAYLKLADQTRASWKGRTHFLAVGAGVMRRLLINHARDRDAVKRGRSWERVALTAALTSPGSVLCDVEQLLSLNRAVDRLAELDERQAAVVTLRFFGGLTVDEIAEVLEVSPRTVNNDWLHARVWLFRELVGEADA